jgi:hypothetical protein
MSASTPLAITASIAALACCAKIIFAASSVLRIALQVFRIKPNSLPESSNLSSGPQEYLLFGSYCAIM